MPLVVPEYGVVKLVPTITDPSDDTPRNAGWLLVVSGSRGITLVVPAVTSKRVARVAPASACVPYSTEPSAETEAALVLAGSAGIRVARFRRSVNPPGVTVTRIA